MDDLLRFDGAVRRDPQIEAWFAGLSGPLGSIPRTWFERMRGCGDDVVELLHDGCPVACVQDAPFGYVNAFKSYVNVGFFRGAMLPDPAGLLEGQGKRMRHVKLRADQEIDSEALNDLILAAYDDIRVSLQAADGHSKKANTMKKSSSASKKAAEGKATSQPIDWRTEMLARIRTLIQQADPEVVEEVKWRKPSNPAGVPVWSHDGIICTGETYKNAVKLTFMKGAALEDPARLFNSSLEGNARRAIDLHEGDKVDENALKALIRAAVALNTSADTTARPARSPRSPRKPSST